MQVSCCTRVQVAYVDIYWLYRQSDEKKPLKTTTIKEENCIRKPARPIISRPALSLEKSQRFKNIFPPFSFMAACTPPGMDSTSWCKTCWLMLPQHDLTVFQKKFLISSWDDLVWQKKLTTTCWVHASLKVCCHKNKRRTDWDLLKSIYVILLQSVFFNDSMRLIWHGLHKLVQKRPADTCDRSMICTALEGWEGQTFCSILLWWVIRCGTNLWGPCRVGCMPSLK